MRKPILLFQYMPDFCNLSGYDQMVSIYYKIKATVALKGGTLPFNRKNYTFQKIIKYHKALSMFILKV